MKSISPGLDAHLGGAVTTICTCWKITRADGKVLGFTDHDQSFTYQNVRYKAATGFYRSAISNSADSSVDNLEVSGFLDSDSLDETELRNGTYDYAKVEVFALNWADLSQGIVRLRYGAFGEVMIVSSGFFKVELRGLTQLFAQTIGETYSPECRADFGDHRCKIKLVPDAHVAGDFYKAGDRVIVPQLPGVNSIIDVKNPGFELNTLRAWTVMNGDAIVVNKPWEVYNPFEAQSDWWHEPTTTSGMVRFSRTREQIGTIADLPSFNIMTKARIGGGRFRLKMYWGTADAVDAAGEFSVISGWTDIPVGVFTFPTSILPEIAPTGTTNATRYIYFEIEWSEVVSGSVRFHGYPRRALGEIIPQARLSPSTTTITLVDNWTWGPTGANRSQVSGPNVWLAPYSGGDWMMELYPIARQDAWVYQDVVLDPLQTELMTAIDEGKIKTRIDAKLGAETAGIASFVTLRFYTSTGAQIRVATQEEIYTHTRGAWGDHTFEATVPPDTRRVRIELHSKNVSDNAVARAVWDNVHVRAYEDDYANQDNYLGYGGVEFEAASDGVTSAFTPSFNYALGAFTTDGSVSWKAVPGRYTDLGMISEVITQKQFKVPALDKPNKWFEWGVVEILSGLNLKKKVEVQSWDNETKIITLALPLPYIPVVGDRLRIQAGCDKSRKTCHEGFNNMVNYRGEPDLPGTDQFFKVGGANTGGTQ
jgi:uncharacterized phage protein (TIGR02218 family)